MRSFLILPLALVALLAPSAASAASAAPERCSARGATVKLENDVARVFYVRGKGELKRTWYGCLRGSSPRVLTRDVDPRRDDETHTTNTRFVLGGGSVAWVSTAFSDFGAGEFGRSVEIRSLRRGGPSSSIDVQGIDVLALAVRDGGAAGWVLNGGGAYREVEGLAAGAKESDSLAFARGIDPASLSIDAAGVHWTESGVARTAEPRVPAPAQPRTGTPGPQTLDPGYGSCGALQTPLPQRASAAALRMARAPDGSIVVGGGSDFRRHAERFMVTRLRPDGAIDTSFGNGGAVVTPVPGATDGQAKLTGVAVQADGKIVVSGHVRSNAALDYRAVLARYNADGSLDQSFGQGGFVADALPGANSEQILDVTIAADGGIVAAGLTGAYSDDDPQGERQRLTAARYRPDGSLDPAFGSGGVATVDPGTGGSQANVIRAVGSKLLVGGRAGQQFALVRLNADGSLDASFGNGGMTLDSPPASAELVALALLPDGRVAALGAAYNGVYRSAVALVRYDADGHVDPSFGTGGFAVDRHASGPTALLVRDDGRLLVAGAVTYADFWGGPGLLRYAADGSRDESFGLHGGLGIFKSFGVQLNALVAQPDGSVLAAEQIAGEAAIGRFAIDDPALAAVADAPRACSAAVATKSLKQLLRRGKTARYGKLRVTFERTQPGDVRVQAVATVGGRSATIGTVTLSSPTAGTDSVEIALSKSAYRLLRSARQADIAVTVTGTAGAAATGTRTLHR
jgi:uncharacterized delta-60 repeat protein